MVLFIIVPLNYTGKSWVSPILGFGICMGVATGGDGGTCPPGSEFWGMSPPEIAIFKENFLSIYQKVEIFWYFRNKVGEIWGENPNLGVLTHLNPSPQSKLCGDAPGDMMQYPEKSNQWHAREDMTSELSGIPLVNFSGFCIICWNLNLVKQDSGQVRSDQYLWPTVMAQNLGPSGSHEMNPK